jgi:hypothetical protein
MSSDWEIRKAYKIWVSEHFLAKDLNSELPEYEVTVLTIQF